MYGVVVLVFSIAEVGKLTENQCKHSHVQAALTHASL